MCKKKKINKCIPVDLTGKFRTQIPNGLFSSLSQLFCKESKGHPCVGRELCVLFDVQFMADVFTAEGK